MRATRAVFFEEDDARRVAARLAADGFDANVSREPFAGEDDDEDHPWAVSTDAPAVMVELVAEEYDGWVDEWVDGDDGVDQEPTVVPPVDLPAAPRRRHRE